MKNKRNYTLYICIEIIILSIAVLIGFVAYKYLNEIPDIYPPVKMIGGVVSGGVVFIKLEVIRKIMFNE